MKNLLYILLFVPLALFGQYCPPPSYFTTPSCYSGGFWPGDFPVQNQSTFIIGSSELSQFVGGQIGAFYDDYCVGLENITGDVVYITLCGDDSSTPDQDGLSSGAAPSFAILYDGNVISVTETMFTGYVTNGIVSTNEIALASCGESGCTDTDACNTMFMYFSVDYSDNGLCTYPQAGYNCDGVCIDSNSNEICDFDEGCIDNTAFNYDPVATQDDGSCYAIIEGCLDDAYYNYNDYDFDGNPNGLTGIETIDINTNNTAYCIDIVLGCSNPNYIEYNSNVNEDDNSCLTLIVYGCMDEAACNYDTNATIDDGTCMTDTDSDGVCDDFEVVGCTDTNALNYISSATDDDGCEYSLIYQLNDSFEAWYLSIDLQEGWNMFGYGCPEAINVIDALSNYIEDILIVKDNNGDVYLPEYGFNGIGDFTPGFGYQIKLTEAIEGFSLCDWYVNDIPEDNIVSLQEENASLHAELDSINSIINIGDYAHGGVVFYLSDDNQRGLVASYEILENSNFHSCFTPNIDIDGPKPHSFFDGASGKEIGSGYQNTKDILNATESWCENNGAFAVSNYSLDGYDDWFLPSINELQEIFISLSQNQLEEIGYSVNEKYWSSSEDSIHTAFKGYTYNTHTEVFDEELKDNIYPVIPIRAFGNWNYGCYDSLSCSFDLNINMLDNYQCIYNDVGYDCDGNYINGIHIGMEAFGGIVFYIDETGEHGLVASPEDLPDYYQWGCNGSGISGAYGEVVWTGYQNTLDIVEGCSETPTAASEALAYESQGYSDWYLPSLDEIYLMYINISNGSIYGNIGNFEFVDYEQSNTPNTYWSSTQSSSYTSYNFDFFDGTEDYINKSYQFNVRPIRSF